MREIIKYQLKGQKNAMILLLSIIGSVNLITWGVEIIAILSGSWNFTPALMFWLPLASISTSVVGIVLFFLCSSGHVDQLLYKDSNYLMLTIPRRGWEILGGRIIAGFIEFLVYAIAASLIALIHGGIISILASRGEFSFFSVLGTFLTKGVALNLPALFQLSLYSLSMFITIGVFLSFAAVISRSFIKNKGIASAIAVVVFITVINWTVNLGTFLSSKMNWYTTITLRIPQDFTGFNSMMHMREQTAQIPFTPFLIFLILSAALFAATSWLLEKKVEI